MTKFNRVLFVASMLISASLSPLQAQSNSPDQNTLACADDKCNDEIRTLHRMARFGSFEAMTLLSMVYATGDGREADPERALSYIERAVSHRHPMAVFLLSEWYQEGFVVAQDNQQADALLIEAVKLNYAPAQYKKALQLLQHAEDDKVAEGLTLLTKASNSRLIDAMFLLGQLKQKGHYMAADLEAAAKLFENLVLSGHEESRPFLQETIAILAAKPDKAELVADLQQSYDIEVIQVIGRDFKGDTMLTNFVNQMRSLGLFTRGGAGRIKTGRCDGRNGCYTVAPRAGDTNVVQVLSGRR